VRFYLGTHVVTWLRQRQFAGVPLFVSRRQLMKGRLPYAAKGVTWALDSGAFSEIDLHGKWTWTPRRYALWVRTAEHYVGGMEWAACMDWMCEPHMVKKTGLTIKEHQRRTVQNYLELRDLAPDVNWSPSLQGWEPSDYLRCIEMYARAGVDLRVLPRVGLGSVCRRQHTEEIIAVLDAVRPYNLRLHGFGVKVRGLRRAGEGAFISTDSLAWSFAARRQWHSYGVRLQSCTHRGSCANCSAYALAWRERILDSVDFSCDTVVAA
jgi:hypothetical protein